MDRSVADIVVIGAGPAGAAAARLLSLWGHSVCLVGRPPRHPSLAESLPPSCAKLFEELGVRRLVDDAGFLPTTGNTVRWADQATRVERFDAGILGYQVERNELDALLAGAARAAGAVVHTDVSVRDVTREGDDWLITYDGASGSGEVRAAWLLDCSGRAGVVARRGFRKPETGGRTTAVAGVWERASAWPVADESHTLVESYPGGWAWSVPVTTRRRFVTVMLDPAIAGLPGRGQLGAAYAAELARTTMLRDLVDGASMTGDVWGCDASPYSATRAFDSRMLLVGDAVSFVDPLSSFGVKKALASAWLGAVAVHTALTDSAMTTPALELFADRERTIYEELQRQSALLSREAAGAHAGDFWSGRGESALIHESGGWDAATLRSDPRVLAAFEELKQRPSVNLRRPDAVRVVDRAAVRGHRIVLEEHLSGPDTPAGVRYCRNVDMVVITRLADRYDQVPDLYNAYNRAALPAPLPDFLGALSAMVAFGLLSFA